MLCVGQSEDGDKSQRIQSRRESTVGIKPIISQAASRDLTCAAVWRSGDRDKFLLALFLKARNKQGLPTAIP